MIQFACAQTGEEKDQNMNFEKLQFYIYICHYVDKALNLFYFMTLVNLSFLAIIYGKLI